MASDREVETLGSTTTDGGISNVIGRKPTPQMLKELNTPVVPNVADKERSKVGLGSKGTGMVRMKNVGPPTSSLN